MKKAKLYLRFVSATIFLVPSVKLFAQQCGNCKTTPSVAQYDLDVQVPQPELKGEKTKGWLEWQQLFWLARHANSTLYKNNKDCVRFTQPASNDNDELVVGQNYANIPGANTNISQYGNYFITGSVKQTGDDYVMHIELKSSCSRKTVASADVPFQLSAESSNTISIANKAASQLSPLIEKIKKFEAAERKEKTDAAWGGLNRELIKITPAKKNLLSGQETDIEIVLSDCDGIPLGGRLISFTKGTVGDAPMPGTIGGIVTPSEITTDANGKAKAKFRKTARTELPAIINAHTLTATSSNCTDAFIGSAQLDGLPAYKIVVNYIKTRRYDLNMYSDEDGVGMTASQQSMEDVNYSFSLLHYPPSAIKDGEQVIIMPQFQNDPAYDRATHGTTFVLQNDGYSEYIMKGTDLALVKSPFGAPPQKNEPGQQRYFSSSPLPPSASLMFQNNDLVFFSGGVEFPEVEDGLSPVSSSFGIEKNNKKYFPLKPKKITDPNSPYKWVYEFEYKNEDGYSQSGKVFKQGSKEIETATVQIWKSF